MSHRKHPPVTAEAVTEAARDRLRSAVSDQQLREPLAIAADFAWFSYENHEARILGMAYLALLSQVETLTEAVREYEKRLGIPNFASLAVVPVGKQP